MALIKTSRERSKISAFLRPYPRIHKKGCQQTQESLAFTSQGREATLGGWGKGRFALSAS